MSNEWMKDLDDHIKGGPAATDPMFPTAITAAERALGFQEITIKKPGGAYAFEPAEVRIVALDATAGLRAVKMLGPHGLEYVIWNSETNRPVESPSPSLDDLKVRLHLR